MDNLFLSGHHAEGWFSVLLIMRVLVSAFLSALFLQSGIDKLVDRQGNLEWLTGHFANTPFKNIVPLMLGQITFMEVTTGVLCGLGALALLFKQNTCVALIGVTLAAITILSLFVGQRIAKDYEGAAVLVNYFILTLIGLYLLQ